MKHICKLLIIPCTLTAALISTIAPCPAFVRNSFPDTNRQLIQQSLSEDQIASIHNILQAYDSSSLTSDDAQKIVKAFMKNGIPAGPSLHDAIIQAGFDPRKIRTLAQPNPTRSQRSLNPTSSLPARRFPVPPPPKQLPPYTEPDPVIPNTTGPPPESGSYPIVDTGQERCYDSFGNKISCPTEENLIYGQDAQHNGNMPNLINNGDGTVSDSVTGLMWQQSPDTDNDGDIDTTDKMTFQEAVAHAKNYSLAGYNDWRLPSIKELYSLIDFHGTDPSGYQGLDDSAFIPFINTNHFDFAYGDTNSNERLIDAQFASSTLYVANTGNDGGQTLFGVNFADGRIKGYGLSLFDRDKTFYVLYVRGKTSYGFNNFHDQNDGTIIDSASNLMWSKGDSGRGMNWEESLDWVQEKNNGKHLGYNDWRLPNAKELQGLVDYSRSPATSNSAAISHLFETTTITNEAGQLDFPSFWSSTTHANWTAIPGRNGVYVSFGRAMGYMHGRWLDVHGAGAQRSDPKIGDPAQWPYGHGPQGDAIRINNYIRLVRDAYQIAEN